MRLANRKAACYFRVAGSLPEFLSSSFKDSNVVSGIFSSVCSSVWDLSGSLVVFHYVPAHTRTLMTDASFRGVRENTFQDMPSTKSFIEKNDFDNALIKVQNKS